MAFVTSPDAVDDSVDVDDVSGNEVSRAVRDFARLHAARNELRSELRAHGVPLRVTKVLVELGLQNQSDEQAVAFDAALAQAWREHGEGSLDRATLEGQVASIIQLDREMGQARRRAGDAGLDVPALAILSQLVQTNPGDGGEQAVNRLIAYARACDITLDGVPDMAARLSVPAASVLPDIARMPESRAESRAETWAETWVPHLRDAVLGLIIGVVVIRLLI